MTGRTRATVTGLILVAIVAYVGGMLTVNELDDPAPVPVLLPERPEPQPYLLPTVYAMELTYWCDRTGVPVWMAARLFAWESGFNASYHGRRNENGSYDLGLAALNTYSIPYFQAKYNDGQAINPFDPATAIKVGVQYLADLYSQTGDWGLAIGAYNAGLGTPRRDWKMTTVRHVRAIMGGAK